MKRSQNKRSGANERPADPGSKALPLVLRTPEGPERWLAAVRASLLDLVAAAREGARHPRERVLSRAEIRRQAQEAFFSAYALVDEAAAALKLAAPLATKSPR